MFNRPERERKREWYLLLFGECSSRRMEQNSGNVFASLIGGSSEHSNGISSLLSLKWTSRRRRSLLSSIPCCSSFSSSSPNLFRIPSSRQWTRNHSFTPRNDLLHHYFHFHFHFHFHFSFENECKQAFSLSLSLSLSLSSPTSLLDARRKRLQSVSSELRRTEIDSFYNSLSLSLNLPVVRRVFVFWQNFSLSFFTPTISLIGITRVTRNREKRHSTPRGRKTEKIRERLRERTGFASREERNNIQPEDPQHVTDRTFILSSQRERERRDHGNVRSLAEKAMDWSTYWRASELRGQERRVEGSNVDQGQGERSEANPSPSEPWTASPVGKKWTSGVFCLRGLCLWKLALKSCIHLNFLNWGEPWWLPRTERWQRNVSQTKFCDQKPLSLESSSRFERRLKISRKKVFFCSLAQSSCHYLSSRTEEIFNWGREWFSSAILAVQLSLVYPWTVHMNWGENQSISILEERRDFGGELLPAESLRFERSFLADS